MRFLLLLLILLGFPVLDLGATWRVADWTGVPVWAWLAAGMLYGVLLLRNERASFRARTLAALTGRAPLAYVLLDSGRKVLAGFFLVLPGVVSDLVALLLLLLPFNLDAYLSTQQAGARSRTLDGDFRRVD